jgi:nitrogen regulatory protein P-II 1
MKMIVAIIRPERLNLVKSALEEKGIMGMTVSSVHGRGEQKGLELMHRAGKYRVDFLEKIKIELAVKDEALDMVIDTICQSARTGEIGDGKIFVLPVESAIKVRTGQADR